VRGTTLIPKLIAALMLSAAIPAAARAGQATDPPETRALALAAERDAKSATVTTPKRTSLEEKLYWYDNQHLLDKVFAGWHGLHLAGGDFPAGAGTKYGIGYDTASPEAIHPNRVDVSARAARSTMGYTRVSGSVAVRPVPAPIEINLGAQTYEFPQEDFFGFGSSSLESNRTDYLLKSNLARIAPAIEAALERESARAEKIRAELALSASERRFRSLVQNSSDLVTIVAPDGSILYASDSAERIVGYSEL